jgi:outer membrane protein assembly factor BamB
VVYAVTGDGVLRTLGQGSGRETQKPWQFVPAGSYLSDLVMVGGVAYASTMNNCGGTPDGVWAMDINSSDKATVSWKTGGGSPLGAPALSSTGTVYVAVGEGKTAAGGYSNSVVALDGKTLALKDSFTAPAALASEPVVFSNGGREYVTAEAKDGRIFLLDADSLGGADHKTALAVTPATGAAVALATWEEANGTRWVIGSSAGSVAAYKLEPENGKPALRPAWTSQKLATLKAPILVNGVVFALSGGSASSPAVLYALDGATGKALWNSGSKISSWVDRAGLSSSQGQVYVVTHDHTFYAFGIPVNKMDENR